MAEVEVPDDVAPDSVCNELHTIDNSGSYVAEVLNLSHVLGKAKSSEEADDKSEVQYRLLFDANPVPMWVFECSTLRFLAVNEAAVRQYGFSRDEFLGMTLADIRPSEDLPRLLASVALPIRGLQGAELWRHRKKDGALIDVEIIAHDIDFHGVAAELVAALDVTERIRAEQARHLAEEKYQSIFDDAVIGIIQGTPEGRPLTVNRAFARLHGYDSPEQFMSEICDAGKQIFVDPTRLQQLSQTLSAGGRVVGAEVQVYHRDGSTRWASLNMKAVRDSNGTVLLHAGTVEDITDRKLAEDRVQFLAYHDVLTGLPNRLLLQDRLLKALSAADRRKHKLAILFLDVDGFKLINDSLGHSFGDLLLQQVAERLKPCVREEDTLARIGGDEFLITLAHVVDANDAAIAAGRIMRSMRPEFVVQGHSLKISCSIGISIFPDHGTDAEALIKNADAAMYCAKENGRNALRSFTDEMNAQVVERLTIENGLRYALQRNELFLLYQPQFEIATARITGFEALLRWRHPQLGLIPPDRFIPIAETTGSILPIGEWVLRTASAQARQWQEKGLPALPIAVNVSAVQFMHHGFRDLLKTVLAESRLDPQCLELELTESALLSNANATPTILRSLKKMGLQLTIDDFGTGYSNLNYLRQFPVDKLKIDRSFIKDVAVDTDDAAITAAIVGMARALRLTTVAEGIENDAQMSFLQACHCDQIQGYLLGVPMNVSEATNLLLTRTLLGAKAQSGSLSKEGLTRSWDVALPRLA